jgi:retron-type reverse transcriptase
VAALNLNYERSNANNDLGFRPALACSRIKCSHETLSARRQKELYSCAFESTNWQYWNGYDKYLLKRENGSHQFKLEKRMPITHSNLWERIANFENLYQGYRAASRNKRFSDAALNYQKCLEENLINSLNQLLWKEWKPSSYHEFYVHDPKKRLISAPPFKDRVVHHALIRVIEPLFERKFISDSYACRKGKGTHAAKERAEAFAISAHKKWGEYYVLKADIKSYFHSIDRHILMDIIRRTISDKNVLWLIERIVMVDGDRSGIPIGALTSQLFANVYMDSLDHYIKDTLGVKMYARYMDDFLVVHPDKEYLRKLLADIESFITDRLHLSLNPKTSIFKSGETSCHAIDFCGYRIWPGHTKPRKRTVKCARKRFKHLADLYGKGMIGLDRIRSSIMSFLGYMKHCNGSRSLEAVLDGAVYIKSAEEIRSQYVLQNPPKAPSCMRAEQPRRQSRPLAAR